MSRLTDKDSYCLMHCADDYMEIFGIGENCNLYKACFERKMYDKLKHYEDLEEAGRLPSLPCAVGDIVYRINPGAKGPIIPLGVVSIELKGITDTFKEIKCKDCAFGGENYYRFTDIGKTVFLTKAEAEAKLAELKGGDQ